MNELGDLYSRDELLSFGFACVGENVKIFRKCTLVHCRNIYLGDGCQIDDFVHIIAAREIVIGKRVHVGCFTSIAGGGEVFIGDYCGLSAGCRLISGTDDFFGGGLVGPTIPMEYRNVTRSFIRMNDFSLLGSNTIVFPGVTLEEGAATGAGTIVTKDLAAWGIYMGPGAKKIHDRSSETIKKHLAEMVRVYGY